MLQLTERSCIDLRAFDAPELEALVESALGMKTERLKTDLLKGKTIGLLFGVPSTRTRVSFQIAVRDLGGTTEQYNTSDLQLSNRETLVDTGEVLGRFLDGLVVRMYDMHHYGEARRGLETLAQHARIPFVNALDDKDHPCQVLADLLTLREKFGPDFRRRKLVMSWAYSNRKKTPGVLHSMLTAASLLGMNVTFAHPPGYELDAEYTEFARGAAERSGATIAFSQDLDEACADADAIYAKSYMSLPMGYDADGEHRESLRESWRITERHFRAAKPGAYFMDCMPLVRGEEADADVVDGPRSIRYDQAENRLHAQKALLAHLYRGRT